jgi:hypothetical protein
MKSMGVGMDALPTEGATPQEYSIRELIDGNCDQQLTRLLAELLGDFCLCDLQGAVVLMYGEVALHDQEIDIVLEDVTPIGSLKANVSQSTLRPVAELLEMLLLSQKRYQVATCLLKGMSNS